MQQEWVVSRHGYRIACRNNWDGQNQVAIVCHGFGSSKNSPHGTGPGPNLASPWDRGIQF